MKCFVLSTLIAIAVADSVSYGTFTYPQHPPTRYATPNAKPTTTISTYAAHYTEVSHLLGDLTTTTYGSWDPEASNTATDSDDPYGQWAWTQRWIDAEIKNFTETGLYSTTVEPTAIPTESLIRPPRDAFHFDDDLKFPADFIFGVAGSAAQIEGAVADQGKGPSIQERLVSNSRPKNYITNENYYLYKQDIARLAAMGVKYYSFSISWSRILPFAVPGSPINQEGLDHYDDLINTCLEYGITPVATLIHFDTPWGFNGNHNISGVDTDEVFPYRFNGAFWGELNGYSFEESFINYGKIVMAHYADRVPIWVGYNEPLLFLGFPSGAKPVVKSTAALHKFYHEELKGQGKFGIKFNDNFGMPRDPTNADDIAAAERFNDLSLKIFANPLFLGENVPASFPATFYEYDDLEYTEEELAEVAGHVDFFGVDPYTYTVIAALDDVESCQANSSHSLWPNCVNSSQVRQDGWKEGYRSQSYVYITPDEHRAYLNYMYKTFHSPVLIGEFGFPEWRESEKALGDQLFDQARSIYYRSFLDATLKAIHLDGVEVLGAFAWSFADNWEFGDYEQQFGIQVVNRTTQERYYKKSFFDIVEFVEERSC